LSFGVGGEQVVDEGADLVQSTTVAGPYPPTWKLVSTSSAASSASRRSSVA